VTKRRAVVLVLVLIAGPALFVAEQAVETLYTLRRVERQRDTWQQPEQILQRLNLRSGLTVVDLGSGAGYFALKMAPRVAPQGRVLAVDLRRQSLAFLWIRALLGGHWNLRVIRGETDDPHLPPGPVDAALVANTFHELAMPEPVLKALFTAMRAGATLVVVDRAPHDDVESSRDDILHHDIEPSEVERAIARLGFETVSRDDHFIERDAGGERWWLIVFRKP
jgi:predicted methyltransferase